MLFQTNSLFSFLVFFPFFSLFVLIFFLFFLLYSFFYIVKIPCFSIPFTGHGEGLFIVPAVTSVLLFCPLNRLCLVWVYLPIVQNLCQTEADPFCPFCAPRTHFVLLRAAAFPATMFISSLLTLRACTQRFPLKLPFLGGLSSQQDVPPKRGLSRGRK